MNIASSSRCHLGRWPRTSISRACLTQRPFAGAANPQPEIGANTSIRTHERAIPSWKVEGRMRPQPNPSLSIDPDHPLHAFFRKDMWSKEQADSNAPPKYLPFEPYWAARFASGRPWTARELRRKSFKDLHVLWYVIARERNLLATQRQTVARYGMKDRTRFSYPDLDLKCRTTMARIKQVLNERRIACLGAAKLMLERGELAPNSDDTGTPPTAGSSGESEDLSDAPYVVSEDPISKVSS